MLKDGKQDKKQNEEFTISTGTSADNPTIRQGVKNPLRRTFIKKAVVGGIAVVSTASLAKKVSSMASADSANKAYLNDDIQQDKIMMQKNYVLMTREEKEQMVKTLADSYKEQA